MRYEKNQFFGSIEITTRIGCVCMCEYCPQTMLIKEYRGDKKEKKKDTMMSFDVFKKCISTVPSDVALHFTGYVEPFENPECHKFILHAHNKGHRVMVNTTLVGLDIDRYDEIKHLPFKQFNIHCPSSTFKENIGVVKPPKYLPTGQKELRREWMELLVYIFNDHPEELSLHYHGGLHPQVEEIFEYTGIDVSKYTKQSVTSDRAQNLVDGGDNIIQHTKVPPEKNIRAKCGRIYQPVLIPDGRLGLCCQDYGLKHTFGNLLEQTWEEYRNSAAFEDLVINGAELCDYCVRMDENYTG